MIENFYQKIKCDKIKLISKIMILILVVSFIMPIIPVYGQKEVIKIHKVKTSWVNKKHKLLNTKFSVKDVPDKLMDIANVDVDKVKAIDDVDSLDLKSFTTVNSNNTKTVHVYNEPIKYYDQEENSIKFIDSTLKKSKKSKYSYENTAGEYKIFIPEKMNNHVIIEDEENNFVKFRPNMKGAGKANKVTSVFLGQEEEVVEFKDVFGTGYNLQYVPQNNSIKENIIISENKGKYKFDFTIETNGLIPDTNKGKIINFIKKEQNIKKLNEEDNNDIVFSFGELFIRDSYIGQPDGKNHLSIDNYYKVTDLGNFKYKLSYILDEKFLNSESTQYPVLVDPSISPITKIYDAPVYSKRAKENFRYNAWIQVGKVGGTYGYGRGYFKTSAEQMKKLTYINPQNITSAKLRLYEGSGTTYTSKVRAFNNSKRWKVDSITYDNKPAYSGGAVDNVKISKSGFYNFSITPLVKNWLKSVLNEGGYDADYGVVLIRDTSADGRKDFCSANYGVSSKQPSISITYKEDTSIADNTYFITNYNSGKRLEALRENKRFPSVVQNGITSNDNQQWKVKYVNNGYYTLANNYYGAKGYLDVDDEVKNNPADIWRDGLDPYNKFKIVKNNDGTGTYRIMSKELEDLAALHIPDGSKEVKARAKFAAYNGAKSSQWTFSPVTAPYNGTDLKVSSIIIPKCITFTTKDYSVNIFNSYITTQKKTTTKIEVLDSSNKVVYTIYKDTPAMDGGTSTKINFQWNATKKGNYTFRVTVDSGNVVSESNENNNVYIKNFYVAGILPVNGYEIPYEPNRWNDAPPGSNVDDDVNIPLYVQHQTNCYAYALNLQRYPLPSFEPFPLPLNRGDGRYGKGLQPQELFLYYNHSNAHPSENQGADTIEANVSQDMNALKGVFRRVNREDMCSEGTYKVALVTYYMDDYHWYRQNPDGTWSHKPGCGEVTNKDFSGNVIYDPAESDTGKYGRNVRYYEISQIQNGMYNERLIVTPNSGETMKEALVRELGTRAAETIDTVVLRGNASMKDGVSKEDSAKILPKLKKVDLSGFTGRLGSFAFHSCANLETVILPTSDIVFPSYAFTDCVKLVTMKRADNLDAKNEIDLTVVTSIGNYALQNTAVTTVKVPKKYAISHYCFMSAKNLTTIYKEGTSPKVGEVDLSGMTYIGFGAFWNYFGTINSAPKFRSVKLPKGISLSGNCFKNCFNLNKVQFDAMQDTKVTIGKAAFYGVDLSCAAYMNEVLVNDIDFVIPISETANMIKKCY